MISRTVLSTSYAWYNSSLDRGAATVGSASTCANSSACSAGVDSAGAALRIVAIVQIGLTSTCMGRYRFMLGKSYRSLVILLSMRCITTKEVAPTFVETSPAPLSSYVTHNIAQSDSHNTDVEYGGSLTSSVWISKLDDHRNACRCTVPIPTPLPSNRDAYNAHECHHLDLAFRYRVRCTVDGCWLVM